MKISFDIRKAFQDKNYSTETEVDVDLLFEEIESQ
jgi:hypothetical protein